MAEIRPFKGIRFNQQRITKYEDVVTPPYDVIGPEEQDRYYKLNPYNIIRMELGKTTPDDEENDNQYTRASQYFEDWLNDGILIKEKKPAIYFYEQEFTYSSQRYTRSGMIATVRLEDYENDVILPHEQTLPKAKLDRLQLMRECHANFSPIFGLFMDEQKRFEEIFDKVKQQYSPTINFTDENNESHIIWIVDDKSIIETCQSLLGNKRIYIADGHHRYETAMEFEREMRAKGYEGYDEVMMTLVNIYNQGLIVLPTHRLLYNLPDFKPNELLNELKELFDVESITYTAPAENLPAQIKSHLLEQSESSHRIAFYTGGDTVHYITVPKQTNRHNPDKSMAWNKLDITVLQQRILDDLLGIGEKERSEGNILTYVKDIEKGINEVHKGNFQAAFFVNPTKVDEVIEVASEGDKMPQKSTHFYPKLITGLVINSFQD